MLPPQIMAYIYAALGAIIAGLSLTVYVEHERLDKATAVNAALETKLFVSNQSVTDLTKALTDVRDMLDAAAKADADKQTKINSALAVIKEKDKSLTALEGRLKDRKPTQDCTTPKDLVDAWNSL